MRKIKNINFAKSLLEDTKDSLKKEIEIYDKCKDIELKKLYLNNINKFKKTIQELEEELKEK